MANKQEESSKLILPVLLIASSFFHDMTFFDVYNLFPQLIAPLLSLFCLAFEENQTINIKQKIIIKKRSQIVTNLLINITLQKIEIVVLIDH